jgi:hypothetical protein
MRMTLSNPLRVLGLGLGLGLISAPSAWAGKVEDDVQAALTAINDGDFEQARVRLDEAEADALISSSVVLSQSLASIWFYRGVLEYYDGDRDQKTLELWRLALLADLEYAFDTTLVADQEPQDLFEALRLEVGARTHVEPGVREDRPNVKVFVDGRLLNQFELVVEGRHLVQVHCPDAKLYNEWYTFGQAPNYYALCEGGTLGGGAVADAGGGKGGKGGKKPDEDKPPREPKEPKDPRPERDINMTRVAVMGAGGALFLGGAVLNFAAVNPTYAEIEAVRAAPATMNRAEADALSAQFNMLRFSTIGLLGVGAAGLGVGYFVTDDTALLVSPAGVGLTGRF